MVVALRTVPGFRQFGREPGRKRVSLYADMMGDQANDPLAVFRGKRRAGIGHAGFQAINPDPAVGIEHELDDGVVSQQGAEVRAERGAQHARAPIIGWIGKRLECHGTPRNSCENSRGLLRMPGFSL